MYKVLRTSVWALFVIFALLVGIFPFVFYVLDIPFGIIRLKEESVLLNLYWKIGFHIHIIFGALALFIGWVQFIPVLRRKSLNTHRIIGKAYIFSVLLSSLAGISSSFFANGGTAAFLGLFTVGWIWLITALLGYKYAREQKISLHKNMMMYNYAATFGGVTLRIWLPLLLKHSGDFNWSYDIVTWLSWIPNLLVAHCLIINDRKRLQDQSVKQIT